MSFALIAVVVVVLLVVVSLLMGVFGAGGLKRRDDRVKEQAEVFEGAPLAGALRYHVPHGQDPAAVMAALESEGYPATLDSGAQEVVVPCPRGADHDRERVREVIAQARLNLEGDSVSTPVVFEDES